MEQDDENRKIRSSSSTPSGKIKRRCQSLLIGKRSRSSSLFNSPGRALRRVNSDVGSLGQQPKIDVTDTQIRLAWRVGSWLEIFSKGEDFWYLARITRLLNDAQGEWLEVRYGSAKPPDEDGILVQRFSKDIRSFQRSYQVEEARSTEEELKEAEENFEELQRYVRRCVLDVETYLKRPISKNSIPSQIVEVEDMMRNQGRLHGYNRLQFKHRALHNEVLAEIVSNAKTPDKIADLKDAIRKHGSFCTL